MKKELTGREAHAVRLANQGMNIAEIAAVTEWKRQTVRKLLCFARKKGAQLPERMPSSPCERFVPIKALLDARADLIAAGKTRGMPRFIARRLQMKEGTVRARLFKHDAKQKHKAAGASR